MAEVARMGTRLGEPDVESIGARVQELLGEGKSVEEVQKIIQKEFGAHVQIRIGSSTRIFGHR